MKLEGAAKEKERVSGWILSKILFVLKKGSVKTCCKKLESPGVTF